MPAVPTVDEGAVFDGTFREGEAQVRAEVFEGVEGLIPLEEGDVEAVDLDAMSEPVFGDFIYLSGFHPPKLHRCCRLR